GNPAFSSSNPPDIQRYGGATDETGDRRADRSRPLETPRENGTSSMALKRVLVLAAALLVAAPASAHADPSAIRIGPATLTPTAAVVDFGKTAFNLQDSAPASGTIHDWSGNFECVSDPCGGQARLVVLTPTLDFSTYAVRNKSAWQPVTDQGVAYFSTSQAIE